MSRNFFKVVIENSPSRTCRGRPREARLSSLLTPRLIIFYYMLMTKRYRGGVDFFI